MSEPTRNRPRNMDEHRDKMRTHMSRSTALRAAVDYATTEQSTYCTPSRAEKVNDILDLAVRFENYINTGSTTP